MQGEQMQVHTTALLLDQCHPLWTQQEVYSVYICLSRLIVFRAWFTWLNRFVQTLKGLMLIFFKGSQKFSLSDISPACTNSPIDFSPCSLALSKDSKTSDGVIVSEAILISGIFSPSYWPISNGFTNFVSMHWMILFRSFSSLSILCDPSSLWKLEPAEVPLNFQRGCCCCHHMSCECTPISCSLHASNSGNSSFGFRISIIEIVCNYEVCKESPAVKIYTIPQTVLC